MTIEEIEKLGNDEQNNKLRLPKSLKGETKERIMMAHQQFVIIVDKIIRNKDNCEDVKDFICSDYGRSKMKSAGISNIIPLNNWVGSYELKSELANGIFFDAHKLFIDGKYPKWIKPNNCFSNTHLHILQTKLNATVLSGIAFVGKPFLHSVLLIGDSVIDFNYDLVASKDLYFALTHFEVLAELDYKKLLEHEKIIREIKGVQNYVFNFAFEEVIEQEMMKQSIIDRVGV